MLLCQPQANNVKPQSRDKDWCILSCHELKRKDCLGITANEQGFAHVWN
jgi:hypothetical protein